MEVIFLSYPFKSDKEISPSSMAIGFFDGIHLGHQQVIGQAVHFAKKLNIQSSVMTFDPHPMQVLGKKSPQIITPLDEKINILEDIGIDIVYVVSFTKIFSKLSPEDFLEKFLISLKPQHITVGFDFTFGSFGKGKAEDLKRMANHRFGVSIVPPIQNGTGIKISSTLIRDNIKMGNIAAVNNDLGRHYKEPLSLSSRSASFNMLI